MPEAGVTLDDLALTGPGTLAGRYLRRFWQPLCLSREIASGELRREQIMGEFVTVYRGESGAIHVVADRCAHRGVQLSVGWVQGEEIRCFYHGWKFAASGQCTEMPAETPEYAKRIRIRAYPARDYLDVVFAYLGEGEAPEFPRYPELEDEAEGALVAAARAPVPCNFFQRVENAVDQVHVAFAHQDVFGMEGAPEIPDYSVELTSYGICARGRRPGKQDRLTHFHMPNINVMRVPPNKDEVGWAPNVVWRVPIDDSHHRSVNIRRVRKAEGATGGVERNYQRGTTDRQVEVARAVLDGRMSLDQLDPVADRAIIVAVQDNVAQMGQGTIAPRAQDHLGRSDVGVAAVRRLWLDELRAFAEGRLLRDWSRPPGGLTMTSGAEPERS
jgi:5,5'-dehydrodivanillate O-demethylase